MTEKEKSMEGLCERNSDFRGRAEGGQGGTEDATKKPLVATLVDGSQRGSLTGRLKFSTPRRKGAAQDEFRGQQHLVITDGISNGVSYPRTS